MRKTSFFRVTLFLSIIGIGFGVTTHVVGAQGVLDRLKRAAEEAAKKAEERQKPQQPPPTPQPSQPSNPPRTTAAPSDAVSGDCCSPDALRKMASSAGFLDIVGIKLGMTPEQAFAAVKAHNGQMKIDIVNARMEFPDGPPGNFTPVPQFAVAHTVGTRLGQNPTPFVLADGSEDVIVLEFTIPPSPPLLARIVRQITFPQGQLVVASNLLDALRKKYGQERPGGVSTMWMFDSAGKAVSRPLQQPETICAQSNLFAGLGGWGGGGLMPRPEDMGRDAPTQLSLSHLALNGNGAPSPGAHAPCRPFVIAEAYPLSEGIPPNQQMGQMTVAVYSSGLLYGSRKATHDWLQAKSDAKTKQLEDAAKARSAPKL